MMTIFIFGWTIPLSYNHVLRVILPQCITGQTQHLHRSKHALRPQILRVIFWKAIKIKSSGQFDYNNHLRLC